MPKVYIWNAIHENAGGASGWMQSGVRSQIGKRKLTWCVINIRTFHQFQAGKGCGLVWNRQTDTNANWWRFRRFNSRRLELFLRNKSTPDKIIYLRILRICWSSIREILISSIAHKYIIKILMLTLHSNKKVMIKLIENLLIDIWVSSLSIFQSVLQHEINWTAILLEMLISLCHKWLSVV